MPNCRSCKAPIVWAMNEKSGKHMPFDPEPVSGGHWVLLVISGKRQAIYDGTRLNGYVSHFFTCPHAAQHRRRRSEGGD